MKFKDIKFKIANGGIKALIKFKNGYGASIIKNPMSYGYERGLYEIAVTKGGGNYVMKLI